MLFRDATWRYFVRFLPNEKWLVWGEKRWGAIWSLFMTSKPQHSWENRCLMHPKALGSPQSSEPEEWLASSRLELACPPPMQSYRAHRLSSCLPDPQLTVHHSLQNMGWAWWGPDGKGAARKPRSKADTMGTCDLDFRGCLTQVWEQRVRGAEQVTPVRIWNFTPFQLNLFNEVLRPTGSHNTDLSETCVKKYYLRT